MEMKWNVSNKKITYEKITAKTTQEAMNLVQKRFGSQAYIYDIRKKEGGVELIAGLPNDQAEIETKDQKFENEKLEELWKEPQVILDEKKQSERIKKILKMYHFPSSFINYYLKNHGLTLENDSNLSLIKTDLKRFIFTSPVDVYEKNKFCLFVGPSGAGKTSALLNTARRYLKNHTCNSIGLISTDKRYLSSTCEIMQFSNLYGIDFEFAFSLKELYFHVSKMKNKKLILIDTASIQPNTEHHYSSYYNLFSPLGIDMYQILVLPAFLQSRICEKYIEYFSNKPIDGCVISRCDEVDTLAPIASILGMNQIPVLYLQGETKADPFRLSNSSILIEEIFFKEFKNQNNKQKFLKAIL